MVKKAVIPAAGLGTRFLPATKVQPKEMLPIIDTPTIQYVIQEAVDAGIEDILVITGKGKRAIEDHFDRNFELESHLEGNGNQAWNDEIRRLSDMANIHFIRQKEMNGLGDAINHARFHTGDEPFVVLLGDTVMRSAIPVTQQLIDIYEQYQCSILGVETVPKEKVSRYGILGGNQISDHIMEVTDLIEKPTPKEAPSNFAIAARYILTPEIYKALEETPRGKNNEIQITDALKILMQREKIMAYKFEGKRYDIGNKLDYLKTTIEFALEREEFAKPLMAFMKEICSGKKKN
ncbi:UTP--glucose-1-phosphate uridylyltransferase GalU [candidate division KSB1 bacterium]|nr:UTP--glucose-1-phosphate uridylyltransferase GalU [candidate division KSB1 bacterium]